MKRIPLIGLVFFIAFSALAQEKVKTEIYNPSENAQQALNQALTDARKTQKHVFVQVGGNWCGWCIAFHELMQADTTLTHTLNENYIPLKVNYSKEVKNLDVLARLGNPQRFGFPVFVVLNAQGEVLHIQNSAYLELSGLDPNGKALLGHDKQKVFDFLKHWTPKALEPQQYQLAK